MSLINSLKRLSGFVSPWEKLHDPNAQDNSYDPRMLVDDDGNVSRSQTALSDALAGSQLIEKRKATLRDKEFQAKFVDGTDRSGLPMNWAHSPGLDFMNMQGFNGILAMKENAANVQGRNFRMKPTRRQVAPGATAPEPWSLGGASDGSAFSLGGKADGSAFTLGGGSQPDGNPPTSVVTRALAQLRRGR